MNLIQVEGLRLTRKLLYNYHVAQLLKLGKKSKNRRNQAESEKVFFYFCSIKNQITFYIRWFHEKKLSYRRTVIPIQHPVQTSRSVRDRDGQYANRLVSISHRIKSSLGLPFDTPGPELAFRKNSKRFLSNSLPPKQWDNNISRSKLKKISKRRLNCLNLRFLSQLNQSKRLKIRW